MTDSNIVHREVERAFSGRYSPRHGLVTSYDPKTHTAKFSIQPDGQETGWLPLPTISIGNKWGIVVGPAIGDQMILGFAENDLEVGHVTGRIHSDQQTPPSVESGEMAFISQFGHQITMTKDGQLHITTSQKDTPGQNNNKAPHITVNTTAGNVTVNATFANKMGGQIVHTSSDGDKKKHTVTLDPSKGITLNSTDGGQNTHTVTLDPSAGISHTSTVAINLNAPSSNMVLKNLTVQGYVNVVTNPDGLTGGVLNASRGLGAPVTDAILGTVPTS